MDPAAVKELQRLYRKKLAKDDGRPAKKRKMQQNDAVDSDDSINSTANQVAQKIQTADEGSEDSFEHFGDEEALPDTTSTSNKVEVISFDERNLSLPEAGAVRGYKSFMSGKVPKLGSVPVTGSEKSTPQSGDASDDEDSEDDLRKDKELQRLLRESHLLHEQGGTSLETQGKIRQKAISQQLISNGAAAPAARKMPIGMRKGIQAAAKKREAAQDKYERDAGIVGARKTSSASISASSAFSTHHKPKKQNKTLHELNLGKYKNGKLSITRKEIDRVNATDRKPGGGGRGGKGKKRGFRTFSNIG